jgi:hypothetical protein
LNVGTGDNNAWNNVDTTVVISNGRTISISLDDNDNTILWINKSMELLKKSKMYRYIFIYLFIKAI